MKNFRLLGFFMALLLLLTDQITKQLVLAWFAEGGETIRLTPFMNIVFTWNPGVSFGFLRAGSPTASWALFAVAATISAMVTYWLWRSPNRYQALCYGAILGGAIGNIIDRGVYGAVVDFIDWHAFGYHWYVFNIADCGIVVGAILLVVYAFLYEDAQTDNKEKIS